MSALFEHSLFNKDISNWNVAKVNTMSFLFNNSAFTGDISKWNALNVFDIFGIFSNCPAPVPYWAKITKQKDRVEAIHSYYQKKQIDELLITRPINKPVLKI